MIGILFAAAFFSIAGDEWARSPGPIRPLMFGLATVAAPFLLLQPGMGAGIVARRTPSPWVSRGRSLQAHATFGIGIWIGMVLLDVG